MKSSDSVANVLDDKVLSGIKNISMQANSPKKRQMNANNGSRFSNTAPQTPNRRFQLNSRPHSVSPQPSPEMQKLIAMHQQQQELLQANLFLQQQALVHNRAVEIQRHPMYETIMNQTNGIHKQSKGNDSHGRGNNLRKQSTPRRNGRVEAKDTTLDLTGFNNLASPTTKLSTKSPKFVKRTVRENEPIRQPVGPPNIDVLKAAPTALVTGSKNFASRSTQRLEPIKPPPRKFNAEALEFNPAPKDKNTLIVN